jgi:hypothetical protein
MNFVSFFVNLKIIDPFFEGYIYVCMMYSSYGPVVVQELEAMMAGGSQVRWGNHMAYLVLPISLKHYSDPLDQVRAAKKMSDSKKASLEGLFTFWSATLLSWLAGPSLTTMLTRRAILQTTLTVSNVPGPIEPVMLDNNPIVHIFPVVSGHPQVCISSSQSCIFPIPNNSKKAMT